MVDDAAAVGADNRLDLASVKMNEAEIVSAATILASCGHVGAAEYLLEALKTLRALVAELVAVRAELSAERNESEGLRERVGMVSEVAAEMLSTFTRHGSVGRECVRSGWQDVERVASWRERLGL